MDIPTIIKKEPALLVGLAISVLTLLGQVVSGDLTWAAAVPLITGAVARFFVSPANPLPPAAPPIPPAAPLDGGGVA